MKKILLIGGLGYIGTYFYKHLETKYNIKIYDTNFFRQKIEDLENTIIKDIRQISLKDLQDIDFIVHMGELSNDPLGELNRNITHQINHLATARLLELAKKSSIKKFIYMSSASVYGFSQEIMNEKSKINPLTEYSKAKARNEEYLLNNNFPFESIILRNATAFGFSPNLRLDLVVNDFTFNGYTNREINLISDGKPKRPIVHIHDITKIIELIIEEKRNFDKQIFNVGENTMNYSIKDIAQRVGNILNLENIKFGKSDQDQRSYIVNFDKLKNCFPEFEFKYNLTNGIQDLIKNLEDYELTGNEFRINFLQSMISKKKLDAEFYWKQ
jgi:nucleoside-diphosphate-sugar epimerase